jgi:hypothetical protein
VCVCVCMCVELGFEPRASCRLCTAWVTPQASKMLFYLKNTHGLKVRRTVTLS